MPRCSFRNGGVELDSSAYLASKIIAGFRKRLQYISNRYRACWIRIVSLSSGTAFEPCVLAILEKAKEANLAAKNFTQILTLLYVRKSSFFGSYVRRHF